MLRLTLTFAALLTAIAAAGCGGGGAEPPPGTEPLATAPIVASKDGVLHVRVRARAASSSIAGQRYDGMEIYETEIVDGKGTSTAGTTSTYIAAQWSLQPGDRLIVDYINDLDEIGFDPVAGTPGKVPQPLNLHTHGLTVSPTGNGDNVLLQIPQGRSNRFDIRIPEEQYHGLYWYHPHIHGVTDDQVYNGLAGNIVIGRADGDYREFNDLEVRPLMLRYNLREPDDGRLIDASPYDTKGTALAPRGPMIYTVNGQLTPTIPIRAADGTTAAESQVWALTNVTGSASYIVALDEVDAADATDPDAVGRPLDLVVVSEDGTPMPRPKVLAGRDAARGYLLGQGARAAILVQGASSPGKVVRLLQVQNRSGTGRRSAYEWPKRRYVGGWRDYTRTVLAVSAHDAGRRQPHVDTPARLRTNYSAVPDGLVDAGVDHRRTFEFDGVAAPSDETPNAFPINDGLFPDNRVDQPKAGSVEEWTILNTSSLHHPFHVHTQYGKVMRIESPVNAGFDEPGEYPSVQYVTDMGQPKPSLGTQDVVQIPPAEVGADGMPLLDGDGAVRNPGKVVLKVRFESYLGTYVEHCHRLPHEDRGMMSLVRTIPGDPVLVVSDARVGEVRVVSSRAGVGTVSLKPFGGGRDALSGIAVGDVDGDTVPDVAAASGAGGDTSVVIYSGASRYRRQIAALEVLDDVRRGASLALGDLNADGRDDVIVGAGAGGPPRVEIYDGGTRARLAAFDAYPAARTGGVSVAAGMLEEGGRLSLVTGAGAGGPPTVNVYAFDLFGDDEGRFPDVRKRLTPLRVGSFDGAARGHDGGVAVAVGNPYARAGGFSNVLVTPLDGRGELRTFDVRQHGSGHGPENVGTSGVARPHDYRPDAERMAELVEVVDLGTNGPAVVAARSELDGARVLVVPRRGGDVVEWSAPTAARKLRRTESTGHFGTGVGGM